MRRPSAAVSVICGIFAVILSIILILVAIMVPIADGVMSIANPDNIADTIRSLDIKELMEMSHYSGNEDFTNEFGDDIDLEEFMHSEFAYELIGVYLEQIACELKGETPKIALDKAFIEDAMRRHPQDILNLINGSGADVPLNPDKDTIEFIIANSQDMIAGIVENLPTLADIIEDEEVSNVFSILQGGLVATVRIASIISLAVLSLFIFLFKLYHQRGLVWLAVDFGIAGFLTILIGCVFKVGTFGQSITISVDPSLGFLSGLFGKAGSIILAWGIAFIVLVVLCVVFKIIGERRRAARGDDDFDDDRNDYNPKNYGYSKDYNYKQVE